MKRDAKFSKDMAHLQVYFTQWVASRSLCQCNGEQWKERRIRQSRDFFFSQLGFAEGWRGLLVGAAHTFCRRRQSRHWVLYLPSFFLCLKTKIFSLISRFFGWQKIGSNIEGRRVSELTLSPFEDQGMWRWVPLGADFLLLPYKAKLGFFLVVSPSSWRWFKGGCRAKGAIPIG